MDELMEITSSSDSMRKFIRIPALGVVHKFLPLEPAIPKDGPWPFGTVVIGRPAYRPALNKHLMVIANNDDGGHFTGVTLDDPEHNVSSIYIRKYWEPVDA